MTRSIVVCACIHKNVEGITKILVTKRADNLQFMPGMYELPGGHAENGESDTQALARELKEELNLEIRVGELCGSFDYETAEEKVTENVYLAELISSENHIVLKQDEIASHRWITEEEIDSLIVPNKPEGDQEISIVRQAFQILKS
jgi:8-oxo-dGTP diphosphatase